MDISDNIARIAKDKGAQLQGIAAALGVSRMQLYRYLHGNVTIGNLAKIAAALDVEPWQLLKPYPDQEPDNPTLPNKAKIICPHCGKEIRINFE